MSFKITKPSTNAKESASVNVYKSVKKSFIVKTNIKERDDTVIINRDIVWFDSKTQKYRKRREIQCYHCDDFFEENMDKDTYDNEFNFYNKHIGDAIPTKDTANTSRGELFIKMLS